MPDTYASTTPKSFTLDILEYGIAQHVPKEFMNGLSVVQGPQVDALARTLAIGLYKGVMADQVLRDTKSVAFSKDVTVNIPNGRLRRWLRKPERTVTTTVHGHVTVEAKHFRAFPHSQIKYPKELGRSVKVTKLSQAPGDWRAE